MKDYTEQERERQNALVKKIIEQWVELHNTNNMLNFSYLDLTELSELPAALTVLWCNNNKLTQLPELPAGLRRLDCSYNALTRLVEPVVEPQSGEDPELPELPESLTNLICHNNKLTELPELSIGLTFLYCEKNQLTFLPELPDGLKQLDCLDNKLTELPQLPVGLTDLDCHNNILTELPELPYGLSYLWCHSNPGLPDYDNNKETIQQFNIRVQAIQSKRRTSQRTAKIKEELMAQVWTPVRVMAWEEAGMDME